MSVNDRKKVIERDTKFKFADGKTIESIKEVKILVQIGNKEVAVPTEVTDNEWVAFVTGQRGWEKGKLKIDKINILLQELKMKFTTCVPYFMPASMTNEAVNGFDENNTNSILLTNDKCDTRTTKTKWLEQIASCPDISMEELVPTNSVTDDCQCCQKARDLDRLIVAIKERSPVTTKSEQLKLLSLSPSSCLFEKVSNFFEVSIYMFKRSIELKKEYWVNPTQKLDTKYLMN